jgi:ribonuclease PH
VHVAVLVLEPGGSELAAAITAGSLALADAGIALRDLAPAVVVVAAGSGPGPTAAAAAGTVEQVQVSECVRK